MRDRHPEYWYQSVTKADANGDQGGGHLHELTCGLLLGKSNLCSHHSDRVLKFGKIVGPASVEPAGTTTYIHIAEHLFYNIIYHVIVWVIFMRFNKEF